MASSLKVIVLTLTLATSALSGSVARAWDKHQSLMPSILSGISSGHLADALNLPLTAPCPSDDQAQFDKLASLLLLNPKVTALPTAAEACARKLPTTGREILLGFAVDEPDNGMDRDLPYLPEIYDPQGFQKWMGGSTGPSSQGFRHMYFGGWQLWHPLNTFQIPTGAVGLAPQRTALMALKAREFIRAGGAQSAWGFRLLGWAIHYIQDLAQPFHATQIPSLQMVPWYTALSWPPGRAFEDLVRETTRTISNYHWAYEDYTHLRLTEERSPYTECLAQPDAHSLLTDDARREEALQDPLLLAHRVARASVQLAEKVGSADVRFFSSELKQRGIDLRFNLGTPNYVEMTLRPDLVEQREDLRKVTCAALANAAWATRALIAWATQP